MPRMNLGIPFNFCSQPGCRDGFQSPNLLRCGGCHTVKYCGQAHQIAHRPQHKVQCKPIVQTKTKLAEEEAALRNSPGEDTNGNSFETIVGLFWFFQSTRPYMNARVDYINAILNVRTGEAADIALQQSLGMLRLSRTDNAGARSRVPALYLRLGRDQEAYDFIKWYHTVDGSYGWRDMDQPFLDKHDEDAFEAVIEKPHIPELSFFVALTLLKIRLLKDMESLQDFLRKTPNATPAAIFDHLQEEALSDILLKRPDIVGVPDNHQEIIVELRSQVKQLYAIVERENPHFWPGIMNPNLYAYALPSIYTHGSREEAVLVFRNSWYSWSETEVAIRHIREVIAQDVLPCRH